MSESKVIDCGLICEDEAVLKRFEVLCHEFSYSFKSWPNVEEHMDDENICRMVAFYCPVDEEGQTAQKASEVAQGISYVSADAYRFSILDKMLTKDETTFLKKSGVSCVMTKDDILETSKLEFFASQMIRAEYVAIKEMDLVPSIEVEFDICHLMPLSGKFLTIVRSGQAFDDRKKARMKQYGEFYVHRSNLRKFTEYAKSFSDGSTDSNLRICRAQYLEFQSKFGELAMMLTDESETMSFDEGKDLLDQCKQIAHQLATSLATVGVSGMFNVVNNSSIGEFGSIERAPAIAAYAAFFSMAVGIEKIEDIIFAALIMDLGLIFQHSSTTQKMRENRFKDFTEEEHDFYKRFPQKSIDLILNRRLPLTESFRNSVLRSREQADGNGFPKNLPGEKLTKESQLLGFSAFFDKSTLLTMGSARKDPQRALVDIIGDQLVKGDLFNANFILELKKHFGSNVKLNAA